MQGILQLHLQAKEQFTAAILRQHAEILEKTAELLRKSQPQLPELSVADRITELLRELLQSHLPLANCEIPLAEFCDLKRFSDLKNQLVLFMSELECDSKYIEFADYLTDSAKTLQSLGQTDAIEYILQVQHNLDEIGRTTLQQRKLHEKICAIQNSLVELEVEYREILTLPERISAELCRRQQSQQTKHEIIRKYSHELSDWERREENARIAFSESVPVSLSELLDAPAE